MKTRCNHHADSGLTLVECMVYMAVLAMLLTLSLRAYYHVLESSTQLNRNAADIARSVQAGERWREDVRSASGPLRLVQEEAHDILQVPAAGGGMTSYAWHEGTVWRQATTNTSWRPFLPGVKSSRMELDRRAQVVAWRWEVELLSAQKVARVKPLFTFEAVAPSPKKP